MYLASLSTLPSMPVFLMRSEPAKSTRCSLERRTTSESGRRASIEMVKMQCEREEARFIGVSEIMRLVSPTKSRLSASSSERASWADKFRRCVRPSSSSSSVTLGRSSIDLVRDAYLVDELSALGHLLEDVGDSSGYDPSVDVPLGAPRDREGLAGACLAIGEDGSIVPFEHRVNDRPGDGLKDEFLCG
eukprot:scaffold306354_cov24-Tisochrysis_lutea.AAC.1